MSQAGLQGGSPHQPALDWKIPFGQRDEQFTRVREQMINEGVGLQDNQTLRFIETMKNLTSEVQFSTSLQISQEAEEISRLKNLGVSEVDRQSSEKTAGIQSQAHQALEAAERDARVRVEGVKREEAAAREAMREEAEEQLGMKQHQIDALKLEVANVTQTANINHQEVLRLQASLAEANVVNQQLEGLKERIRAQESTIASGNAVIESLKFALTTCGTTRGDRPLEGGPRIGRFTLKPKSLSDHDGEKSAEKAYAWIEAAERVFIQRAEETCTTGGTARWGTYAIDCLKGTAAEWAHLRWPLVSNNAAG